MVPELAATMVPEPVASKLVIMSQGGPINKAFNHPQRMVVDLRTRQAAPAGVAARSVVDNANVFERVSNEDLLRVKVLADTGDTQSASKMRLLGEFEDFRKKQEVSPTGMDYLGFLVCAFRGAANAPGAKQAVQAVVCAHQHQPNKRRLGCRRRPHAEGKAVIQDVSKGLGAAVMNMKRAGCDGSVSKDPPCCNSCSMELFRRISAPRYKFMVYMLAVTGARPMDLFRAQNVTFSEDTVAVIYGVMKNRRKITLAYQRVIKIPPELLPVPRLVLETAINDYPIVNHVVEVALDYTSWGHTLALCSTQTMLQVLKALGYAQLGNYSWRNHFVNVQIEACTSEDGTVDWPRVCDRTGHTGTRTPQMYLLAADVRLADGNGSYEEALKTPAERKRTRGCAVVEGRLSVEHVH
jgi:integrase